MTKVEQKGRDSLREAVQHDIDSKRTFRTEKELWEKYDWIINRAQHYADKFDLTVDEILNSWEEDRNYWYMNYYQDSNQPLIEGDRVRTFETVEDLLTSIGEKKFRCPSCDGISTNPYACDSGDEMSKGKVCDWKVYGLFGGLGKDVFVFVKEKVKGEHMFMPITWEDDFNGKN